MSDTFELRLERVDGYRFRADFLSPEIPELVVDEPPPLGTGAGPNPARLLAAAVGDCLSASLVFCLSKSRVEPGKVETHVVGRLRRNERNRLRIGGLEVTIRIELPEDDGTKVERCLGLFEDYCVVTASVRKGIDVTVRVEDGQGRELFTSPGTSAG